MIYKYLSWLVMGALLVALYVWEQTQSVRLGYTVDTMRRECEQWEQTNKDLRVRINCLISLDRLDRVAKEKQLINPPQERVIYLND
jgi:cell division protein FtsL